MSTRSLKIINGGDISADILFSARGRAGDITIRALESVLLDGKTLISAGNPFFSGIYTSISAGATGTGGNINIDTDVLSINNGAVLKASSSAIGAAGNTMIDARSVSLNGTGSGIFSALDPGAIGQGGNITLLTNSFWLANGAQINASTNGKGDAGSIIVTANTFDAINGGRLLTTTATNNAGDITLKIRDRLFLSGFGTGLFASTTAASTGRGGNIRVDPRAIAIQSGARIAVDSQGSGEGGNIEIAGGSMILDQRAAISAETASSTGGNISLNLSDLLLLRRGSTISTTAGIAQGDGKGGNINLSAGFVVAVPNENSDMTANAFRGRGKR